MQITIQNKHENPLLNRVELTGTITFEGATPSNTDVAEAAAKEVKGNSTLTVVKNIYTDFGHQEATFTAVVYKDADSKQRTEKMTKHLRKKAEEERKKAEEARKAEEEAKAKAAEEAAAAKEAEATETAEEQPAAESSEEPAPEAPAEEVKAEESQSTEETKEGEQ